MAQTTLSDVEIFLDEETRAGLMKVIDGKQDSFEMKISLSPQRIHEILEEFGITPTGNPIDSNGWEWDFWRDYSNADETKFFVLSGSGWYGGIDFHVKEED